MLRDLDSFVEYLQKFAFLEQLDIFGNPVAEEPDYRFKIIRAMPQIRILDRHKVTHMERWQAQEANKISSVHHLTNNKTQLLESAVARRRS